MRTEPKAASRATLQAVANKAGVSVTTVSLVLAGKGVSRRIADETLQKVRAAAEDLNYAPNLLTRSLRRGRTHIMSFYSSFRGREDDDLYMDRLSSAIEKAGGAAGYDILVHCNFNRSPREVYQFLNGGLADGLLLFAPTADDPLLPILRRSSLPVVLINSRDQEGVFSSICDDLGQGTRLLADAILNNGHRRIAAIDAHGPKVRDASHRIKLLQEELGDRVDIRIWEDRPDRARLVSEILAVEDAPTLIFCWHDRLAYKVLEATDSLGISVPEQLSVIGYDGLRWPSDTRHTASSVHVDLDELARHAVRLLDMTLAGPLDSPLEETLPLTFITGTTLGPNAANS